MFFEQIFKIPSRKTIDKIMKFLNFVGSIYLDNLNQILINWANFKEKPQKTG